jgi:hypothetical protein
MPFNPNEPRDEHGKWTQGGASPEASQAQAAKAAGGFKPLEGLPQKPIKLGNEYYTPGPNARMQEAARDYMKSSGLPYDPPHEYLKVDPERATRIAQAFEDMKHDPEDPKVKASYEAMAKETIAQWNAIKKTGLQVEWLKPDENGNFKDPYADSPRRAEMDVSLHNHLYVFPTDGGFGSGDEASKQAMKNNPLLRPTGETIDGRKVVVNDVFRIVHDMFGHVKEGNGFRADGEENAWRSHSAMYSDLARGAMTSETRGQNSWVNFGPSAAHNKHASGADTIYAPQKIGLLPQWAIDEGRKDRNRT